MEDEKKQFDFNKFSDDIVLKVFTFLTFNQLLQIRLVSRKMNELSKFSLRNRGKVITVKLDAALATIESFMNIHPCANQLKFCGFNCFVERALSLAKEKLQFIEGITVCDDPRVGALLLNASIALQIKKLCLKDMDIDDDYVSNLLRALTNLEKLKLIFGPTTPHARISGKCLIDIGPKVKSITYENIKYAYCDFTAGTLLKTLYGKGQQISHLKVVDNKYWLQSFQCLLERETMNLRLFHLTCEIGTMACFNSLPHLTEAYIEGICFRNIPMNCSPHKALKKLSVVVDALPDVGICYVLSLFPLVQELTLIDRSIRLDSQPFSDLFTESLLKLKLKIFTWYSWLFDNTVLPGFFWTLSQLYFVQTFILAFHVQEPNITKMRELANSRPNQMFYIIMQRNNASLIGTLRARNVYVMIVDNVARELKALQRQLSDVKIEE